MLVSTPDQNFVIRLDVKGLVSVIVMVLRPNISAQSQGQNFGLNFDQEAKISISAGLEAKTSVSNVSSR